MSTKLIRIPFRQEEFARYRIFLLHVFNNYAPGVIRTLNPPPGSSIPIEKISYAIPTEEYESFYESSLEKKFLFTAPKTAKWLEVEFFGNGEYERSSVALYFRADPIGEMEIFARPHLFSLLETKRRLNYLKYNVGTEDGEEAIIVDITGSAQGKRLWVFNAVIKCEEVVELIVSTMWKGVRGKQTKGDSTKIILGEAHIVSCKNEPCVEFWKDWEEILFGNRDIPWKETFLLHKKVFEKWNAHRQLPK
ncbi:MAG: hypothetical protein UW92_C0030G0018 [Candidatus Jorgensenbacteria bacterium GW2011_GWA2_45_13]|uniref:Uncharacterized protein n=1 Tax=Candidatus Jorgensenbacteria bacterium GW2011_GWA2_45_13 TaxID=1618662 RepID=A0A0G1L4M1_9BACT|nr:MAG: hypothetical protein UW92_C0030G0018 [Candidatus Jorgensenbacteria bacterium GW2011_GWA2_45_13]